MKTAAQNGNQRSVSHVQDCYGKDSRLLDVTIGKERGSRGTFGRHSGVGRGAAVCSKLCGQPASFPDHLHSHAIVYSVKKKK